MSFYDYPYDSPNLSRRRRRDEFEYDDDYASIGFDVPPPRSRFGDDPDDYRPSRRRLNWTEEDGDYSHLRRRSYEDDWTSRRDDYSHLYPDRRIAYDGPSSYHPNSRRWDRGALFDPFEQDERPAFRIPDYGGPEIDDCLYDDDDIEPDDSWGSFYSAPRRNPARRRDPSIRTSGIVAEDAWRNRGSPSNYSYAGRPSRPSATPSGHMLEGHFDQAGLGWDRIGRPGTPRPGFGGYDDDYDEPARGFWDGGNDYDIDEDDYDDHEREAMEELRAITRPRQYRELRPMSRFD